MASGSAQQWQLWREDDHGNRVLVEASVDRELLEEKRRDLERGGHKQIYWITPAEGPDTSLTSRFGKTH
jgi:hypothetical protein